uniref:Putative DEAD-box ATP-dependent RNA helicase 48 n=1 Tax=Anthurium amnicola TaxID=1678845 RepID=A0A1D1ZKR0_9ARAE
MAMAILPSALSLPKPPPPALSSVRFLTNVEQFSIPTKLSIRTLDFRESDLTIRMGGGPRTYPGGVSKWQWKRMQAKKAKQLLKARLCRERQIYEMRKRTELNAAISELERPWEVVEKAPNLFSVKADEQLKVLADRFQKPGGFDMWSERDGPQILRPFDGLPSARFFPKGVVHSVKPYGVIANTPESSSLDSSSDEDELQFDDWIARGKGGTRRMRRSSTHRGRSLSDDEGVREAGVSNRGNVTEGSSYVVFSDSGVTRTRGFQNREKTKDQRCPEDRGKMYSTRGRKARNSNLFSSDVPGGVNNEDSAAKLKKVSGRNGLKESYRRSTTVSSSCRPGNNNDRRYSYENLNGLNTNTMAIGRVDRVKMKSNGQENVTGHGFISGRCSLRDKNSQRSDAYRRRQFNWGEDD